MLESQSTEVNEEEKAVKRKWFIYLAEVSALETSEALRWGPKCIYMVPVSKSLNPTNL